MLFVEHADQRFGPFGPIDGPIPLHRYRSFRKSPIDERLDRIEALAGKLGLPRAALEGPAPIPARPVTAPATVPFNDPDPFRELRFPNIIAAKLAIADYLGRPPAKLAAEDLGYIEFVVEQPPPQRHRLAGQRRIDLVVDIAGSARRRAGRVSTLAHFAQIAEEEIWLSKQKSARTRRAYRLDVQTA